MKFRHSVPIFFVLFAVCVRAQDKSISNFAQRCTLVVKIDNGAKIPIWINGTIRGKTPLQIDTLLPGFYDVSFIEPTVRDSILNSAQDPMLKSLTWGGEIWQHGSTEYFLSNGELARESNVKMTIKSHERKEILFQVQKVKEEIEKGKSRGRNKILIGIICSLALIILIFVVPGHLN